MVMASPTRTVAVSSRAIGGCSRSGGATSTTVMVPTDSASPLVMRYPNDTGPVSGPVRVTRTDRCSRTSARIPDATGTSTTPVTSSTPPAGSMSVPATSTVRLLSVGMKTVFGMVIGLVFASGGAETSTLTVPVTVWSLSVTTYST